MPCVETGAVKQSIADYISCWACFAAANAATNLPFPIHPSSVFKSQPQSLVAILTVAVPRSAELMTIDG